MGQDGRSGTASGDHWTRQSATIVLLCFMLNMVDGMDLLIVSFIAPTLQQQWQVSPAELSMVFSAGLAGMAVGGLGLAPLADRFGRRRLITFAISLMAVAMVVSSFAASVPQLAAVRFVVGIGIGTVLACIAAIAAQVAPAKHRNFAVGVLQAGYPVGAMFTGFVTAWALPIYGWQHCILGTAAVSALFVPLILLVLPVDRPAAQASGAPRPTLAQTVAGPRLKTSMLLWVTTICGFMALYFITSWITKLAIEAGLPQDRAIIASAVYNFGAFAGTVVMSIAGTRFNIYRICCVMLTSTAGVFLVFGGVPMPLPGVLATAFVMGITLQGGYNMVYPIAARAYPEEVRATGIGWAFGIGRIGAFTGPAIGGLALDLHMPLVGVFGIFCAPLLLAAFAALRVEKHSNAVSDHP